MSRRESQPALFLPEVRRPTLDGPHVQTVASIPLTEVAGYTTNQPQQRNPP